MIARAPAEVAFDAVADFIFGRAFVFVEEGNGRHDHAGGTETTLKAMTFNESFLNRMEFAVGEPFDRCDRCSFRLNGKHGAGFGCFAIDEHGTGTAVGRFATDVSTRQVEVISKIVDQQSSALDIRSLRGAVDGQGNLHWSSLGCFLLSFDASRCERVLPDLQGPRVVVLGVSYCWAMLERFRRRRTSPQPDETHVSSPYQFLWAILAGGSGVRIGGDKALKRLAGVPLVEWVAGAMRIAGGDPLIVGRSSSISGIAAIPDLTPACSGPLVGLITAMDAAENAARVGDGPAMAIVVGVDLPLVKPATLRFMTALADERRAIVPVVDGDLFAMCGVYPATLLRDALFVCKRGGSVADFLAKVPVRRVEETEWRQWGEDGSSFFTVKTAADLNEAETLL